MILRILVRIEAATVGALQDAAGSIAIGE